MHSRQLIRQAVVDLLKDASIVDAQKVYTHRLLSVSEDELPVINVTTKNERSEPFELCDGDLKRSLTLLVSVTNRSLNSESSDDEVDSLALKVEKAMNGDSTLSGRVMDCTLIGTDFDASRIDGAAGAVVTMTLTYDITYIA